MRHRIGDFCFRWGVVFGLVVLAVYVASGIAMHWCVIRALWRWL